MDIKIFNKIFPVVAGMVIGSAINWIAMSFAFDNRITNNEINIAEMDEFLDNVDGRVGKLETVTLGEINIALASITESIEWLKKSIGAN